jgi:hypothetical protein
MSSYVQLISTEYVFLNTTIDKNTDPGLIDPNIKTSQDVHIQEILGYNLYITIMNQVSDNSINDPSKIQYKTLLNNYIQPCLAHFTVWHALPDIQYRLTNKAILSKTEDHANSTGLKELIYLRDNVKHYADYYNQRIREYIINNPQLFPEYFQTVGIDRIRPKRTTYFSGWSPLPTPARKGGGNGHSDPDCNGCDPFGIPLNW